MTATNVVRLASLALLTGSMALAQQGPPAGPMPSRPMRPMQYQGGRPGMQGHNRGRMHGHMRRGGFHGGMEGGMGGMHMGPGGMWWKNPQIAAKLGLTADQQKRMEDIFLQSRIQLIHIKATLEEQELLLQPLMDANPPDSAKALAQIGKIADTRADLEKADAKMLLGIRGVLTAAQWTSLHDREHQRPGGPDHMGPGGEQRGPGGPGGPNAQGGPGRGWGRGGPWGANGQAPPAAKPSAPPATTPPPPEIQ